MIKTIKDLLSSKGYLPNWPWRVHLNHGILAGVSGIRPEGEDMVFHPAGEHESVWIPLKRVTDEMLADIWNDLKQQLT